MKNNSDVYIKSIHTAATINVIICTESSATCLNAAMIYGSYKKLEYSAHYMGNIDDRINNNTWTAKNTSTNL